jgi:hypothetical protein
MLPARSDHPLRKRFDHKEIARRKAAIAGGLL